MSTAHSELRGTVEVARTLGAPLWLVERVLRDAEIPQPVHVGGVRMWTPEDVERLTSALAARAARVAGRRGRGERRAS